jgi:ABC-type polysaccharide/polyol phosphate transport system ATPase subunit
MITLNSVSKVIGKGEFRRSVLEDVSWQIEPRTDVVILGQRNSGASTLVEIIAGTTLPTSGWVDRRATVSMPGGLLRYALRDTTRQLILRLSRVYRVDPDEVSRFVVEGLAAPEVLDVPPSSLPRQLKQQMNLLLTYAFPCDFYVFNNSPIGAGDARFEAFCKAALEQRSRQAGLIVRRISARAARSMDPDCLGALVYRGRLTLYARLADAISVFENLPPEGSDEPPRDDAEDEAYQAEDDPFSL